MAAVGAIPSMTPAKRKRSDSREHVQQLPAKHHRTNQPMTFSHVGVPASNGGRQESLRHRTSSVGDGVSSTAVGTSHPGQTAGVPDGKPVSARSSKIDWENPTPAQEQQLRKIVEKQFNLEILYKHTELRLIDQEIAKCQIALEQLRRCRVKPYPSMSSNPADMLAVASGHGCTRQSGDQDPRYPPPGGVVDGPYSRHYAKWLLQDADFDGPNADNQDSVTHHLERRLPARSSRSSKNITVAGMAGRTPRSSVTSKQLAALPAGYPEPKESRGPVIVTRKSDGKQVKLVCPGCSRDDFNNVQGFLNHTRIQHSIEYKTHAAAIDACGQTFEVDSNGVPISDSSSAAISSTSKVHRLINAQTLGPRTDGLIKLKLPSKLRQDPAGPAQAAPPTTTVRTASASTPLPKPFVPSPSAPHLSALFAKLGRGGDLQSAVQDAKERVHIDDLADEDEDGDDEEAETPVPRNALRPTSIETSKIKENDAHKQPRTPDTAVGNTPINLSPSATVDSYTNVAPSLVSDYGDDEDEEDERSHSENEDDHEPEHIDISQDHEHAIQHEEEDMELRRSAKARVSPVASRRRRK